MIRMLPVTVCFTYFKSLSLENLDAALFAVRRQDMARVESVVVVDNDTEDSAESIQAVIDSLAFPVPVELVSMKHGDASRTHSWSTNQAIAKAFTPWVLFCRADYLLDFDALAALDAVMQGRPDAWNGFVTGNCYHLNADIRACEQAGWREHGPVVLRAMAGAEVDYTAIDAGVWMMRRSEFHRVGGLDESLTAWGHAQTHFQHKLFEAGTEFVRVPRVLFYHPMHAAPRDLELAHRQLAAQGTNLKEMWARHDGVKPY